MILKKEKKRKENPNLACKRQKKKSNRGTKTQKHKRMSKQRHIV